MKQDTLPLQVLAADLAAHRKNNRRCPSQAEGETIDSEKEVFCNLPGLRCKYQGDEKLFKKTDYYGKLFLAKQNLCTYEACPHLAEAAEHSRVRVAQALQLQE